jgi:hypothetical protein
MLACKRVHLLKFFLVFFCCFCHGDSSGGVFDVVFFERAKSEFFAAETSELRHTFS